MSLQEECAVCLLASSMPLQLPCGHVFCSECVEPWLRRCGSVATWGFPKYPRIRGLLSKTWLRSFFALELESGQPFFVSYSTPSGQEWPRSPRNEPRVFQTWGLLGLGFRV